MKTVLLYSSFTFFFSSINLCNVVTDHLVGNRDMVVQLVTQYMYDAKTGSQTEQRHLDFGL